MGAAADISDIIGRSAEDVVDEMILAARVAPQPRDPSWVNNVPPPRSAPSAVRQQYIRDNRTWVREYRRKWIQELLNVSLRENMTLFWHNHFVTEIATYQYAFFAHRYLKLLRTNCLQYLKEFVRQIGIDPSMLIYLNGNSNNFSRPNENYARELLELFTMSPFDHARNPNYTEDDIKEISRALTGWVISADTGGATFDVQRFDSEPKEIFGLEGDYGYGDVIDIVFSERAEATAHFIARKLYVHFVYHEPDASIVAGLAERLLSNNFAIFDAVGTLLKSEHFYDEAVFGTKIKSPLDFVLQLTKAIGLEETDTLFEQLDEMSQALDQVLFNPPDVAGWQGYRDWITTNSMPLRWAAGEVLLFGGGGLQPADLKAMAADLHDASDPLAAFYLPAAIAEHLLAVNLENVDIPEVTEAFGGDLTSFPVPDEILNAPAYVQNLAKIFLGGAPWYEWYLYSPGANDRLVAFTHHLIQYPDYQLT